MLQYFFPIRYLFVIWHTRAWDEEDGVCTLWPARHSLRQSVQVISIRVFHMFPSGPFTSSGYSSSSPVCTFWTAHAMGVRDRRSYLLVGMMSLTSCIGISMSLGSYGITCGRFPFSGGVFGFCSVFVTLGAVNVLFVTLGGAAVLFFTFGDAS